MTPRLLDANIIPWANRLARYLDQTKSYLQRLTTDSKASDDGVLLWDNENKYPVVSKDGEWRQIVLSDGKFFAYSDQDQTASATNTGQRVTWSHKPTEDGITESGGVITFSRGGVFKISFTAQLLATSGSSKEFYFWAKLNGVDVDGTTIKVTTHSNNQAKVVSRSALFNLNENDTIEAMWAVSNTAGRLDASTVSFAPDSPSATISIVRICQ